jgi:hypothetical protein
MTDSPIPTPAYDAMVARFNRDHCAVEGEDCHLVSRLRADGLVDWQIACVIHAIENTCHHCWDAPRGCQCWNDE